MALQILEVCYEIVILEKWSIWWKIQRANQTFYWAKLHVCFSTFLRNIDPIEWTNRNVISSRSKNASINAKNWNLLSKICPIKYFRFLAFAISVQTVSMNSQNAFLGPYLSVQNQPKIQLKGSFNQPLFWKELYSCPWFVLLQFWNDFALTCIAKRSRVHWKWMQQVQA